MKKRIIATCTTVKATLGSPSSLFPKLLYPAVLCFVIANTINAGTDIGAIAATINLIIPRPITLMIIPIAFIIVALQIWGSYRRIASIFKSVIMFAAAIGMFATWR